MKNFHYLRAHTSHPFTPKVSAILDRNLMCLQVLQPYIIDTDLPDNWKDMDLLCNLYM